jgi:hypothetical protein
VVTDSELRAGKDQWTMGKPLEEMAHPEDDGV